MIKEKKKTDKEKAEKIRNVNFWIFQGKTD